MDKGYFEKYLIYEPETGLLIWKVTLCNTAIAGNVAGTRSKKGYIQVQINKKRYYAHNIAWIMSGGEIPSGYEVDHIDLDKANNKLENLRLSTKSQNQRNRGIHKNNRTGVKGVSFCKQTGLYKARVMLYHKEYFCGRFKTVEEAKEAVIKKRIELHGEFARHN